MDPAPAPAAVAAMRVRRGFRAGVVLPARALEGWWIVRHFSYIA